MTNTELIQEWVEALESGEYKQGTEYLRVDDQYCCLGVVCHLAEDDGFVTETEHDDLRYMEVGHYTEVVLHKYDGVSDVLPKPMQNLLNINETGTFTLHEEGEVQRKDLAEMNDEGATFEEIAAYIRRGLLDNDPNVVFDAPDGRDCD